MRASLNIIHDKVTGLTTNEAILRPRSDLGVEKVEDDLLILDKRNQKVHRLNATASVVWKSLQDGRKQDIIVKDIVEKFDILPEIAQRDVTRVLQEFRALNLLADKV